MNSDSTDVIYSISTLGVRWEGVIYIHNRKEPILMSNPLIYRITDHLNES